MERSRNQYERPMGRLKRLARLVFDHLQSAPEYTSNHWKPSAQVDVGKSEAEARKVQLVIAPIQEYGQQLRFTQPEEGVGYTDRPDEATINAWQRVLHRPYEHPEPPGAA